MSRSYKKNPICPDRKSGRIGKKIANKKVRNYKGYISNGNSYKKIYNSYEIFDYKFRETYQEHKQSLENELKAYLNGGVKYDPRDNSKGFNFLYDDNYWAKYYKRK